MLKRCHNVEVECEPFQEIRRCRGLYGRVSSCCELFAWYNILPRWIFAHLPLAYTSGKTCEVPHSLIESNDQPLRYSLLTISSVKYSSSLSRSLSDRDQVHVYCCNVIKYTFGVTNTSGGRFFSSSSSSSSSSLFPHWSLAH
jgi:hypothetical protein